MNKYYIRKQVLAKNIKEALRKEMKADVCEIYQDYTYIHEPDKKVGFTKHETTKIT